MELFPKLNHDPTKVTERKVQNALCKIKWKLSINEYKRIYPTGSLLEKLYETTKIHKLSDGHGIEKLPIRPISSNLSIPYSNTFGKIIITVKYLKIYRFKQ